jgi:hypothetical protein
MKNHPTQFTRRILFLLSLALGLCVPVLSAQESSDEPPLRVLASTNDPEPENNGDYQVGAIGFGAVTFMDTGESVFTGGQIGGEHYDNVDDFRQALNDIIDSPIADDLLTDRDYRNATEFYQWDAEEAQKELQAADTLDLSAINLDTNDQWNGATDNSAGDVRGGDPYC